MTPDELKACREAFYTWRQEGKYCDFALKSNEQIALDAWLECCECYIPAFRHGSPERVALERLYNKEITVAKCIELIQERRVLKPSPDVTGMMVSVDVSTCDEDHGNRIFARIEDQQSDGNGGIILLACEESRNFTDVTDTQFHP